MFANGRNYTQVGNLKNQPINKARTPNLMYSFC